MEVIVKGRARTEAVTVFNAGINGNNTADLLARLDRDVWEKSPQLVLLMVGTNDMLNEGNWLSLEAYEENYQLLISRIKMKSDVILMTIPPVYAPYILARQPAGTYARQGPQERVDAANAVVRKLAGANQCQCIELDTILLACGGANTDLDGLFQNEANSGVEDGVHPTVNGYRVIASVVYQTIRKLSLTPKRIVCFGDSITYGYKVKGEGTAEGNCYPAILKRLLNAKQ